MAHCDFCCIDFGLHVRGACLFYFNRQASLCVIPCMSQIPYVSLHVYHICTCGVCTYVHVCMHLHTTREPPHMQRPILTAGCSCCGCCLVAQSCPTLCDPMDCSPPGSFVHGDSPGKNTGVGCHYLLQGVFLTLCLLLDPT